MPMKYLLILLVILINSAIASEREHNFADELEVLLRQGIIANNLGLEEVKLGASDFEGGFFIAKDTKVYRISEVLPEMYDEAFDFTLKDYRRFSDIGGIKQFDSAIEYHKLEAIRGNRRAQGLILTKTFTTKIKQLKLSSNEIKCSEKAFHIDDILQRYNELYNCSPSFWGWLYGVELLPIYPEKKYSFYKVLLRNNKNPTNTYRIWMDSIDLKSMGIE